MSVVCGVIMSVVCGVITSVVYVALACSGVVCVANCERKKTDGLLQYFYA